MRKMTSNEIRETWFRFFENHGHKRLESAPLVPIDDDSLLWINAGVAPLKKYFDGSEVPESRRIVNIQKCIRTNDIENVGLTKRHQTFFEMMGNFSIGDYFKEEAIEFAFELLTSEEYFGIPVDKLYMTVYSNDDDTFNKWVSLGVSPDHLVRLDGNFWEIGEGPCGPDSEIFFDRGEEYDPDGNALENFRTDKEQERYVEIWNNVFSQFNSKDGVPREEYKELPSKNIDTGAGLERWACIFQEVDSNFDTDLFTPIISKIEELSGVLYNGEMPFKVIADHIRAITMALSDGAIFENVGRGYVLRRLLRRSVRMGKKIGLNDAFMYKLVDVVVDIMKDSYPNVVEMRANVKSQVLEEENLFHKTLAAGERRLIELMDNSSTKSISGKEVFKLYDTYGFPYELTLEYLEEKGFTTDRGEFDDYMQAQRLMAKASHKQETGMNSQNEALLNFKEKSSFFYDKMIQKGKVIALFEEESQVNEISTTGYVILDKTCFYAESGGQVADTGMLIGENFKARVIDVKKTPNKQNLHKIKILDGIIKAGDNVTCNVDSLRRDMIEANHSSVHLLQYALRSIISDSIKQAGSRVDDQTLRFDFTYTGKLFDEKLIEVEDYVNKLIQTKIPRVVEEMTIDKAKEIGAMALFSEKYGNIVRVVRFGNSIELCGGCHTKNTANIKKFAIFQAESKGSNVYRITAVVGSNITEKLFEAIKPYNDEKIKLLMKAKGIIQTAKSEGIELDFEFVIDNKEPLSYKDVVHEKNELEYLQTEVKNLEKLYEAKRRDKVQASASDYLENIEVINDVNFIFVEKDNEDMKTLKNLADTLANSKENSFVSIVNKTNDSIQLIMKSNSSVHAGNTLKTVVSTLNGNGGGSNSFAQGGIKELVDITLIKDAVVNLIKG